MATINELSSVDEISSSDQVPIYSSSNGDARKASFTTILNYLMGKLTSNDDKITQYSSPNASGFNVQINDSSTSVWLLLTPTGAFAAGTITLPALTNCIDHQEVLVNVTQAITTLTIAGNGAQVTGAPTTLAANGFFRLRFDAVFKGWYRV